MDTWTQDALMQDEMAVLGLKSLYRQYGYKPFRMNRFEEYDFYADKRSFLRSENVITFTDLNGKLMAMKPDVTLSIVKSAPDEGGMQKVYYSENVYRAGENDSRRSFREIMQVGLECIGEIDVYSESEVLLLAARSLSCFGVDFALDISHMGFLTGMLEGLSFSPSQKEALLLAIGSRSVSAVRALCEAIPEADREALCRLTGLYGTQEEILPKLRRLCRNKQCEDALDELEGLFALAVEAGGGFADKLHLDFSIMNDMSYYNGVIFRGFLEGIPRSVLSGGRYDKLVNKMGKSSGAIGFAIYLDALDRLLHTDTGYDVDVLLSYDEKTPPALLVKAVRELTKSGLNVRVQKNADGKLRAKRHICFVEGRAEELE